MLARTVMVSTSIEKPSCPKIKSDRLIEIFGFKVSLVTGQIMSCFQLWKLNVVSMEQN